MALPNARVPILAGLLVAAAQLIACGGDKERRSDEREAERDAPKTELERAVDLLSGDAQERSGAIKRLSQLHADAQTEDAKSQDKTRVKAVVDKIAEPLARLCLDDRVDGQDRSTLIKLLAATRDRRAEPCFKKTLESHAPDAAVDDVQHVLRAISELKLTSLSPQVLALYRKIELENAKARPLRKDLQHALGAVVDKSHEDELIATIERPLDPDNQRAAVSEAMRQDIALRVLGQLRSAKAARPVLKLILSPAKSALANTALLTLVRIGRPSIAAASAVLDGSDKELVQHSTEQQLKSANKDPSGKIPESAVKAAGRAHIGLAAQVLGALGTEASIAPLLAALASAGDDVRSRTVIAVSLTLLPHVAETKEAYRKAYEETPMTAELDGRAARELLADSASDFFDDGFAPWLVKTSAELKGGKDESEVIDPIRTISLVAAMKVMTVGQVTEVDKLAATKAYPADPLDERKKLESTIGAPLSKELEQVKQLLANCKGDEIPAQQLPCFLAAATSEDYQKVDKQLAAIKAAYMLGVIGDARWRDRLIDELPKITNAGARVTALKAIEHLTPKGDAAAADRLQKLYDDAEKAKDEKLTLEYAAFLQTAARLRARLP